LIGPATSFQDQFLTRGQDGNIWFTNDNSIGRITPDGFITMFPLSTQGVHDPLGITSGPDGAIWFTEYNGDRIGRITRDGHVTEFAVPTPDAGPNIITAGPDNTLWFTESSTNGSTRGGIGVIQL